MYIPKDIQEYLAKANQRAAGEGVSEREIRETEEISASKTFTGRLISGQISGNFVSRRPFDFLIFFRKP